MPLRRFLVHTKAHTCRAAELVKKEAGDPSIVINNAGTVTGKLFMDTPDQRFIKLVQVNALAHVWITKVGCSFVEKILSY